jgi:translation initiation factor IF-2
VLFAYTKTTIYLHAGTDYCSIEKHGITQVIRTKTIHIQGRDFTIVDTPGQDIFFRMRNYGASVADLVVLVVAADDGICPQTEVRGCVCVVLGV